VASKYQQKTSKNRDAFSSKNFKSAYQDSRTEEVQHGSGSSSGYPKH
jgi:hypothetical protein